MTKKSTEDSSAKSFVDTCYTISKGLLGAGGLGGMLKAVIGSGVTTDFAILMAVVAAFGIIFLILGYIAEDD